MAGCIEDLQRRQISPVVIVENHTGLVLVALGHGHVAFRITDKVSVCRSYVIFMWRPSNT
jgi:hypothetical protein